ncbi:hypothetical protein [Azoarcus indigens]|uniref:Uncharacterized protein n=1 Tax=Azoarcus indigens TaxID=29545 RepID=A0A4R6DP11_9RHOO|nr:hypothetical protein [Azoarcus indigens]TDN46119.1 hypothetical protein C7389_12748 [Azoarcus indigens]
MKPGFDRPRPPRQPTLPYQAALALKKEKPPRALPAPYARWLERYRMLG